MMDSPQAMGVGCWKTGERMLWNTVVAVTLVAFAGIGLLRAQNIEGTVLGTVKDPSGAVVSGARLHLKNQGTGAERTTTTDANGDYRFTNAPVGSYVLSIEATGFQSEQLSQFDLLARETRRLDLTLKVGTQAQSVDVQAQVADIQTDTTVIAETKTGRELVDLPVAIASRAQGSTSPIYTLTTQPGVQSDSSGNISVAGGNPSQLSISIDGISTMGPKASEQLAPGVDPGIFEMFPSFYAIEEIRISEQIGTAEYGGVADITTVTKSGTNSYHGGLFENFQNSEMNAANPFTNTTPTIKMNNFGIYLGGPVSIPKIYDGHNKTFFFGSFEALRRPDQTIQIQSVPSVAMRSGDLTALGGPIIPTSQISPLSEKMLQYLFPLPNYGPPGATSNNLAAVFQTPINTAQADMRIDQQITSKQSVNFHVTYKNRRVEAPSNGSASLGSFSLPEIDYAFIGGYTYVISPTVVNEFKGGVTGNHYTSNCGVTAAQLQSELGLVGPALSAPPGCADPGVYITGYQNTSQFFGTYTAPGKNRSSQLLDTLTWTKGKHTMKFGADYRYLYGYYTNAYAQSRLGLYSFNGSVTSALLTNGATPAYEPFEAFLLGYPDTSTIASVRQPDNEFYSWSDAFFAQDDWKLSSHLTVNYGLRWEYHPMFRDHLNNIEAFDPTYSSTVNGQVEHGAVIVPNQEALQNVVNPNFVAAIYPVPVLTAAQVGYPQALRYSQKTDFSPRIGVAWKPFDSNRTVVRGGYGRFIQAQLAALADDGGVGASVDDGFFFNSIVNGKPQYSFPYPFPAQLGVPNSQVAGFLLFPHWLDPTVHEWDITLEQDLGKGVGLRLSYDGNHSSDLGAITSVDRVQPNTLGYTAVASQSPYNGEFPDVWARVDDATSNYNALTVAVQKRFSGGLQFQASYIYARNLSNAGGYDPTGGGSEMGGFLTNYSDPMYDYGNTAYTHRHRFLATFLYELPFGKGRRFGANSNKFVDGVLGGWQVAGVIIVQSGSYLSILAPGDPSGTGFNILNGDGRADTVSGVSPYAGQSLNQWINPAAFGDPANNIGRFGDSQVGSVLGPGEQVVSLSLFKHIPIKERIRVEIGGSAANLFNHPNYANPALLDLANVGSGFGQISNVLNAEGAGPRSIQLTGRLTF
jgi:hypothetical protein